MLRKSNVMFISSFALASILFSTGAFAVPFSVTAPVPMEPALLKTNKEDKEALAYMLSMQLYQDTTDKALFYYAPSFRINPASHGALSLVTNTAAVKRRDEVDRLSQDINGFDSIEIDSVTAAYSTLTLKLKSTKLTQAEIDIINTSRKALYDEKQALLNKAQQTQANLPIPYINAKYTRMADLFGLSGFPMTRAELQDDLKRTTNMAKLSGSNGGIMSANIYAGFSPEELGHIRHYKTLRSKLNLSEVKFAVLPVEDIKFFSLAETFLDSEGKEKLGQGALGLFRNMKGSGNLRGATLNFDLTLDGASKFVVAPPYMILPLGIEAKLTVTPPQFEATLDCDFTTGWSVKGRTDVKDGLVIYNNDIYTDMVAKDVATTDRPCTVKITGGSGDAKQEDAVSEAILRLQERFTNLFFTKGELARIDKEKYWAGVQQDIANNRRTGANDSMTTIITDTLGVGWIGTTITTISRAPSFYWYTNIQNVENLSHVKFSEKIVLQRNQRITIPIVADDLCVAWNPAKQRYLACANEEEMRAAKTVQEATSEALNSDECATVADNAECGAIRNQEAPVNSNGNIAPAQTPVPPPTTTLPDDI